MVVLFLLTKVQEPQNPGQKTALVSSLNTHFPDSYRDIGNDNYLVATSRPLIAQDVTKQIGISDGIAGSYLVTGLEPYFGWANKTIWDWIKAMKDRDVGS